MDLSNYLGFFPLPEPRRYYEVCLGRAHLFSLDASSLIAGDPDQASWIEARLTLSTARWKIVQMAGTLDAGALQLNYRSWGADLALTGFANYERAEWLGLPVINNGCGGKELDSEAHYDAAPFAQKFFDAGHFGAGKLTVNNGELKYEFYSAAQVLLDSLTLTK